MKNVYLESEHTVTDKSMATAQETSGEAGSANHRTRSCLTSFDRVSGEQLGRLGTLAGHRNLWRGRSDAIVATTRCGKLRPNLRTGALLPV